MTLTIKSLENPFNTPLGVLIAAGVAELAISGMGSGSDPGWNCRALYAENEDGEVVGILCWRIEEWNQDAVILLGYVKPEFRRQGIYSKLFAALEQQATRVQLRSVTGSTHARNIHLQEAALKQGRELYSLVYRKMLPLISETVEISVPTASENTTP